MEISFTIPAWMALPLKIVGGVVLFIVAVVICGLAYIGWQFVKEGPWFRW